jgi:hypothetical protein
LRKPERTMVIAEARISNRIADRIACLGKWAGAGPQGDGMKHVKRLIVAAIVVVVLVVVGAVLGIDRLARTGVEAGSTYALGVPTTLNKADIGIVSGRSELSGLTIANPKGFDADHLLTLNEGALDVSVGSLTKDTVEIPEFSLTGIDVNLESKATGSNYKVILENLGRFESGKDAQTGQQEGKKFIIREIIIKNVKVHVNLSPLGGSLLKVTVPIDELRLRNVSGESDKGIVLAQLADTLIKAILTATIERGQGIVPGDMLNELGSGLKNLTSLADGGTTLSVAVDGKLKEVGEELNKAAKQLGATTKDAERALKGVGDLLKKKEAK